MWYAYLGTLLTKAALPIAGAALAAVLSLAAALWWTSSRLSDARDRLSQAQADTLTCIRANESHIGTIEKLRRAQEFNRTALEAAISRQQDAAKRIEELEADRNEQTTDTIERIIRVADGDLCAGTAIPDRLRDAASRNTD